MNNASLLHDKDEVVKLSLHARAIKDIGNEEFRNFFYKMAPWQFILIVSATSVGEELFFTAAVQDEVVKLSPHARAIRDIEDEEL
ncbi:hypothetical protein BC332_20967 [Capsicum chinense]|nr:hypothetical protein BC332_20967 [Capsicum chinense]